MKFNVKYPALLRDPLRGYSRMEKGAAYMLDWVGDLCVTRFGKVPIVTEMGRTREDQERCYFPFYRQHLGDFMLGPQLDEMAREMARNRYSLHCLAMPTGEFRAFDLRSSTFTEDERLVLIQEVRNRFANAECLDHALPGGAWHLHFGLKWPARPKDWL